LGLPLGKEAVEESQGKPDHQSNPSNRIQPNPTESNQIKPNQTKSNLRRWKRVPKLDTRVAEEAQEYNPVKPRRT
jgi:cell division septum initiation protein DivIVA